MAPLTSPHGPVRLVEDWSVPPGQLNLTLPTRGSMLNAAGGLTSTVVSAGADVHPPSEAVTLNEPEELVVAFGMEGFCIVELNPSGPVQL